MYEYKAELVSSVISKKKNQKVQWQRSMNKMVKFKKKYEEDGGLESQVVHNLCQADIDKDLLNEA